MKSIFVVWCMGFEDPLAYYSKQDEADRHRLDLERELGDGIPVFVEDIKDLMRKALNEDTKDAA